jgi:hypothetical protein
MEKVLWSEFCDPTAWCAIGYIPSRPKAEHVLTLPRELGAVTKLEVRNGKLLASTESGIKMIVHKPR